LITGFWQVRFQVWHPWLVMKNFLVLILLDGPAFSR
jgi:hypothetical protein